MPRYDDRDCYGHRYGGDRYGSDRLYVGHLFSRTRSRDLEDLFRYGSLVVLISARPREFADLWNCLGQWRDRIKPMQFY